MSREVTALAPWFGSNRMLAHAVGEELTGCNWVGVPCAGGMSEIRHIKASTLVVGDKHEHLIHLAKVVGDPLLGPKLYRRLRRVPFHPWPLEVSQRFCATYDPPAWPSISDEVRLNYAEAYFICCWMGRSAKAGTETEFRGNLPVRWSASGGDSNTRFRSATSALLDFRRAFQRCNFVCLDVFDFLLSVKDEPKHGIYVDPPFPGAGDVYRHKFTPADHRRLAARLKGFTAARVVIRYYDDPLIRELYPETDWTWRRLKGRSQANGETPEVLILNGPSCSSTTDEPLLATAN